MAVHELQFTNILRLKNGNIAIKWSDTKTKANEKMQFMMALGRLKKDMEEELQRKSLPINPYADKEGRVAALAKEIKQLKKGFDEQLFALVSTCTPIQYQNSAMADAAVGYQFVFDSGFIYETPKLVTPGELLSSPRVMDRGMFFWRFQVMPMPGSVSATLVEPDSGMELIPVTKISELYSLCIAVLREWGFKSYFSHVNEYAFRHDIKTSIAAVSIITKKDEMDDFWVMAPAINKIKDRLISGVRILDDVSFLSYLYLTMAEDATKMLDSIITPAMARMLDELGRGEMAKDIIREVPFPTPEGGNTAIKMPGLLNAGMGEMLLGEETYKKLVEKFDAWMVDDNDKTKKIRTLLADIENALVNAIELDEKLPMKSGIMPYVLISLPPNNQQELVKNMEQRGYDLFRLLELGY